MAGRVESGAPLWFHPRALRLPSFSSRCVAPALAGAAGLAAFLVQFGLAALDPGNVNWLMSADWGQHLLGWLMFRHADWSWPLGTIQTLAWPVGASLGYTDSLPLMSLPLKVLSPLLPDPLQFIGLWLALCFVLMGVFGALFTSAFSRKTLHVALGGALFALSPVLMTRAIHNHNTPHDSLCAQWVLVALLWLNVRKEAPLRSTLAWAFGLVAISAAIHPVLWAMTCALAFALVARLRLEGQLNWRGVGALSAGLVALTAAIFVSVGYLGGGSISRSGDGFGWYSADLLTLFNPMGTSRFLSDLPRKGGQYEGFGYLGLGVLLLLGISLVVYFFPRKDLDRGPRRLWIPVLVAAVLMSLFAASSVVTFAGKPVVRLDALYKPVLSAVAPFRSSGRFIWPLHYLLVGIGLAMLLRYWRGSDLWKAVVLASVVLVQAVDIRRVEVPTRMDDAWNKLRSPRWDALAQDRSKLLLYPPQLRTGGAGGCAESSAWHGEFYLSAGWLALRHRMTVNSGYLSRMDVPKAEAYCREYMQAVRQGDLDASALYVVARSGRADFQRLSAQVRCEPLDGLYACVKAN